MTQETFAEMARRHREADMLVANTFEMLDGQACSIGCFCHDYGLQPNDFLGLAKITKYPEAAHQLQEAIFEGLPETDRADWHVAFAEKAETVTDWKSVIDKTVLASLRIAEPHDTSTVKTVSAAVNLYQRRLNGDEPSENDWFNVCDLAAEMTGHPARCSWASTWAARDSSWSAREAAQVAARAAATAAAAADWAEGNSWDADAWNAAWNAAWVQIRDAFLNA
jgi:hypothetical protein